jgi:hypothetical protein
MWKKSVNSKFTYTMFFAILAACMFLPISPSILIILSAITALIYSRIKGGNNA